MADIFISYKSERRHAIEHLARILEHHGFTVWFDYGLLSGQSFSRQIEREIRAAKAVLVVWCSLSVDSEWVNNEARLASKLGTMIPLWIEDVELPLEFNGAEAINLKTWDGSARSHELDRLFEQIGRKVGHEEKPNNNAIKEFESTWRRHGAPTLLNFPVAKVIPEFEEGQAARNRPARQTADEERSQNRGQQKKDPEIEQSGRQKIFALLGVLAIVVAIGLFTTWTFGPKKEREPSNDDRPQTVEADRPIVTSPPVGITPQPIIKTPESVTAVETPPAVVTTPSPPQIIVTTPPSTVALVPETPAVVVPPTETAALNLTPPSTRQERPTGPIIADKAPTPGQAWSGPEFFRDCSLCPVMARLPLGKALIGSPEREVGRKAEEGPRREINFATPIAIGRSEVSFAEWDACVAEGGCRFHRPDDYGMGRGFSPAIFISWDDANAYAAWLSAKTGASYRLPTEAEWEFAARGCQSQACVNNPFSFGEEIKPDDANYNWNISYNGSQRRLPRRKTMAIDEGSKPNGFGLLHVHGNVAEWVQDCSGRNYQSLTGDGRPQIGGDCQSRIVRGGHWNDDPRAVRSAARAWEEQGARSPYIGFRIVRNLDGAVK